jgi:hypothetical protein
MSTVPHNASRTDVVELPPTVIPASGCDIAAALRHFEATADGLGARRPPSDELANLTNHVVSFTRELFPGKLVVETDVDPEMSDEVCLLFQVEAAGSVKEILSIEDAWVRRLIALAPQWPGLFCLFIDAKE